jgi:hypothetical protein
MAGPDQVERDLLHAPEDVSEATRARIPTKGSVHGLLAPPGRRWAVGGWGFFRAEYDGSPYGIRGIDVPAGEPSRWLTLFGSRVLDWWERAVSAR